MCRSMRPKRSKSLLLSSPPVLTGQAKKCHYPLSALFSLHTRLSLGLHNLWAWKCLLRLHHRQFAEIWHFLLWAPCWAADNGDFFLLLSLHSHAHERDEHHYHGNGIFSMKIVVERMKDRGSEGEKFKLLIVVTAWERERKRQGRMNDGQSDQTV